MRGEALQVWVILDDGHPIVACTFAPEPRAVGTFSAQRQRVVEGETHPKGWRTVLGAQGVWMVGLVETPTALDEALDSYRNADEEDAS